jgi:HPt (histidine-containing phosphotransfer) domain-containing protein
MFMANGFDGFISKPIHIRQLNAILNRLVRDKYSQDVVEAARKLKNDHIRFKESKKTHLGTHRQILELFMRDAEKAVAVMEDINNNNYRRNNDIKMYIITIHSLKTMLAHIGESEISAAAHELEKAARGGKMDTLIADTKDFIEMVKPVIDNVNKILSKENNENIQVEISEAELSFLYEQLSLLKTACNKYNSKSAEDVLTQLRAKTWPLNIQNLLNIITSCLLHSDFDEAEKAIQEFIANEQ